MGVDERHGVHRTRVHRPPCSVRRTSAPRTAAALPHSGRQRVGRRIKPPRARATSCSEVGALGNFEARLLVKGGFLGRPPDSIGGDVRALSRKAGRPQPPYTLWLTMHTACWNPDLEGPERTTQVRRRKRTRALATTTGRVAVAIATVYCFALFCLSEYKVAVMVRALREESVAVCFYGINRSLQHTAKSIHEHLLGPLRAAGYRLDLFYHTYNLSVLHSPRSMEVNVPIDPGGFRLLGPFKAFKVTSQEDFLARFDVQSWIVNHTDTWHDAFVLQSLRNLACQLNSIQTCCNLVQSARVQYSFVMFVRPDMLYLNPLVPVRIRNLLREPRTWLIPDFANDRHRWNDRFVIATPENISPWCHRMDVAPRAVKETRATLHSESLVRAAAQYAGIKKETIDLRFVRVRAGGLINASYDVQWLVLWKMLHLIGYTCRGPCL